MRHNKKFNHLGRTASHRASMLAFHACQHGHFADHAQKNHYDRGQGKGPQEVC